MHAIVKPEKDVQIATMPTRKPNIGNIAHQKNVWFSDTNAGRDARPARSWEAPKSNHHENKGFNENRDKIQEIPIRKKETSSEELWKTTRRRGSTIPAAKAHKEKEKGPQFFYEKKEKG